MSESQNPQGSERQSGQSQSGQSQTGQAQTDPAQTPSQIAEEQAQQRRREGKEYDPNITRGPEEDVRRSGPSSTGESSSAD